MKKVLCINNKIPTGFENVRFDWEPKEGQQYTIKDSLVTTYFDGSGIIASYTLFEDPQNTKYAWPQKWFILLSEIDEMELVNQREVECAE